MMRKFMRIDSALLLGSVLVFLTACSGSTKTIYHTLSSTSVPVQGAKLSKPVPSLGVGPVNVPGLLDRQGIVLRKDEYSVEVSELHEWGGELEDEFTSTLAQHLQMHLPDSQVRTVPWELAQTPLYQVTVTVAQFDGMPAGKAVLKGRWQLQLAKTGKGVRGSLFNLERQVADKSVGAIVRAQSQLVKELAEDIVEGLR
uniref:ABC-type transport auxiliary lipoprotein component domain-containing protein n=1 Tax=uncultured Thiotrichaceae bacterium TaxID=298394 RepID=A0A6S6TD20_9GAMM|nr:MAG: Unknown protein [uncultured Thiotrichaceae bacterium]